MRSVEEMIFQILPMELTMIRLASAASAIPDYLAGFVASSRVRFSHLN
jgi:hypothetical protein